MWPNDHQTCTSSIDGPSSPPHLSHHHCLATLKGHASSYTSALALSADHLFTGSSSGQIHRATLTPPHEAVMIAAAAGEGAVKAIVASSSDKLITAHQDHKIRVWKLHHHNKMTQLATLPTLSDRAAKLLLPGNHVQVRRHKTSTWVHHVDAVSALALSKDDSLLYSVSWDRTLKVWRTGDFKCLQSVPNAHDDAINAVAVNSDGAVYTASSDGRIKVWRRKQGEKSYSLDATLSKHKAGVNALAMSGDGAVLYSGASDALVCAWRSESGAEMAVLRGHTKAVLCLAAVAEHVICSGSADQTVRVWRGIGKASYACLAILEGHRGPIKCIAVHASSDATSNNTCLLYSAALDCDIKVWKLCLSI
ncbi:protein JINGUBANG-like [Salvia hispanica]|uniref:protein JINGUBANG-like n=1 Tax=Salvia hispanica TaxID=49212 RepID=UPI002009C0D6|nr:protein JINGUBANG-like [Salvia hispanica]